MNNRIKIFPSWGLNKLVSLGNDHKWLQKSQKEKLVVINVPPNERTLATYQDYEMDGASSHN